MAKDRKRRKAGKAAGKSRVWSALATRSTTIILWTLALGAVVGWFAAQPALRARVAEARGEPLTVRIHWPPLADDKTRTWLPESVRREISDVALLNLSPDVFDHDSLERTRVALESTGWFSEVSSVRRRDGGVVEIDAMWRVPAAVVRFDARDHLVSVEGDLMPLSYPPNGAGPGLKVIEGVADAGPTRDRVPAWDAGEVRASLALLHTLRSTLGPTRVWRQIAGVDASGYAATRRLAIVTDTGSRVVWGAPPDVVAPGEQTTEQKIARLVRLANGPSERIDAGERLVEIFGAHVYIDQSVGAQGQVAQSPAGG